MFDGRIVHVQGLLRGVELPRGFAFRFTLGYIPGAASRLKRFASGVGVRAENQANEGGTNWSGPLGRGQEIRDVLQLTEKA